MTFIDQQEDTWGAHSAEEWVWRQISQPGITFKDLLLYRFCRLALRLGLPQPFAREQRVEEARGSQTELLQERTNGSSRRALPSYMESLNGKAVGAPGSTQQCSDLRP